jgi:hypothetical protein
MNGRALPQGRERGRAKFAFEEPWRGHAHALHGDRTHDRHVVERRATGVLKAATTLTICRNLAADSQHRRSIRSRRRQRRDHIEDPRAANPERDTEPTRRTRVTVRHVRRPALMRRDDCAQPIRLSHRGHEWIVHPPGDHEQVIDPFGDERPNQK